MRYATGAVRVSVPAAVTFGGTDRAEGALGIAVGMRNETSVEALASQAVIVSVLGQGSHDIIRDERNLIVQALRATQDALGLPRCGVRLVCRNAIPQRRGFSSSSAAIVTGVAAAVGLAGEDKVDRDFIFDVASQMEGRPEAIAPIVYGGVATAWHSQQSAEIPLANADDFAELPQDIRDFRSAYHACSLPADPNLTLLTVIPAAEAGSYAERLEPYADVSVAQQQELSRRLAAFVQVLTSAPTAQTNAELLSLTDDPVRMTILKDFAPDAWQLLTRLRSRGYAAFITSKGPGIAVAHVGDALSGVSRTIRKQWLVGDRWKLRSFPVDSDGLIVTSEQPTDLLSSDSLRGASPQSSAASSGAASQSSAEPAPAQKSESQGASDFDVADPAQWL